MLKGIERELARVLWQIMRKRRFRVCDETFKACRVRVGMLARGQFQYQFLNLCMGLKNQAEEVRRVVWSALRYTKRVFLKQRYGKDVHLSTKCLVDAMRVFNDLRKARNRDVHPFENDDAAGVPLRTFLLHDLRDALSNCETSRLNGLEELLELEITSRLDTMHV